MNEGEETPRLLELLQLTHVRELLPERNIVSARGSNTVAEALELLTRHNILSMPVWDTKKQQYRGMVDMEDIVTLFLSTLSSEPSPQAAEWKFAHVPIGTVINFSHSDVFLPMDGDISIWHLIEVFTRGVHRIPVLNQHGRVINIVSQSSVVKFLDDNIEALGNAGQKSLRQLKLINDSVRTVRSSTKALEALSSLNKDPTVEALAIVDDGGKLCGSISDSDLRGLGYKLFNRLQLPVSEFVALQGRQPPLAAYCCLETLTFAEAIRQMSGNGLHRLWIVDKEQRPVGIVTLLDVMKALMLSSKSPFRRWQERVTAQLTTSCT